MIERELLENAAKAAGIDLADAEWHTDGFYWMPLGTRFWNPLTDDGDALRLAVKLKMDVDQGEIGTSDGTTAAVVHYRRMLKSGQLVWNSCAEPSKDNPLAATRRAIVRSAAEIGRNK